MSRKTNLCLRHAIVAVLLLVTAQAARAQKQPADQSLQPICDGNLLPCDPDPCVRNPCLCEPELCNPNPTPTPYPNPTPTPVPTLTPTPTPGPPRCDFTINDDPLVLISIGYYYLGSGYMIAQANNLSSCVFVYDYAYFQYPLDGFPLYDLGLPIDIWYVYDTGGPLNGFPPYVAFGDIVFAASNGADVTIKDGAIILYVYDF